MFTTTFKDTYGFLDPFEFNLSSLQTGDSNGVIKSWSLENYMLTDKSIKENLPAIESWKAHLDSVNRFSKLI